MYSSRVYKTDLSHMLLDSYIITTDISVITLLLYSYIFFRFISYALFLVSLSLKNQTFCDSVKKISKSDIIFALVQYQHDIIFALLLFCSGTSDKKQLAYLQSVFDAENTIFIPSE